MRPLWPILRGLSWACPMGILLALFFGNDGLGEYGMEDLALAFFIAWLVLFALSVVMEDRWDEDRAIQYAERRYHEREARERLS